MSDREKLSDWVVDVAMDEIAAGLKHDPTWMHKDWLRSSSSLQTIEGEATRVIREAAQLSPPSMPVFAASSFNPPPAELWAEMIKAHSRGGRPQVLTSPDPVKEDPATTALKLLSTPNMK